MRSFLHRLRTQLPPGGESTDERLLDEFLAHRGAGSGTDRTAEDAFTAIVRRHGPMVRGVCRRVLRNDADADDAFQAVFVVLLRKAAGVRPRNRLGNWLYGVAVNVARRGRDANIRRRALALVTDLPDRANPESGGAVEQADLRTLIDQELSGLPDAYRAAVVACDLEGHTRAEAAGRLGWSEGTVASRLARGRALLADRLLRRGVVVPAAGLVVVVGAAPSEAVPTVNFHLLSTSPPPAAEALAKEAIRAMTTSKLKPAAVVLLAVIGLAGAGAATVWACGGYGARPQPTPPPVSEPKPYPFQSVETTEVKVADPAVWARPVPKQIVAAGADKPGTDKVSGESAGIAKSAHFVMLNPAKDITIVSDRHEKFVEFFQRQPVLIAVLPDDAREKILFGDKDTTDFTFLAKASFNVDGPRAAAYGAGVKLARVPLRDPVFRLLEFGTENEPVVFVRDAADKDLWHAVGFTRRSSVGFFTGTKRINPDDFAPVDLLHKEKPRKMGTPPAPPVEPKPTRLVNPAQDIVVFSTRAETIPEFFQRQRIYAGALDAKTVAVLAAGQGTSGKVGVGGTATNDGEVYYATSAEIAAPPPRVAELFAERGTGTGGLTVFFLPDARYADVYHPVGYSTRGPENFFQSNKKPQADDFSPLDLMYSGPVGRAPLPPAKQYVLTNPAGDITVLSDRTETVPEFFHRQQVVVGPLHPPALTVLATGAFTPHEMLREALITDPSYNDRAWTGRTLGSVRTVLPSGRMRHLLSERLRARGGADEQPFVILVPDPNERGAYRLVGFTERKRAPFFADQNKAPGDDFAPADLLRVSPKK
jgi:RNA polymerase sigma factor (sigma-70 family)